MRFKTKDFFLRTAVAILFLSVGDLVVALDVEGYSAAVHDRFYVGVDKDFIGDGIDLSGVSLNRQGASSYTYGTWATMISDTHFVSSMHSPATAADDLVFYQDHDPNGIQWTSGIANEITQELVLGDLFIGKLEIAPPSWVKRYPLLKRPDTASLGFKFFALPEVDSEITMVGLNHSITGGSNSIPSLNSVLLGKSNIVSSVAPEDIEVNGNFITTLAYRQQAISGVQHQADTVDGDSGAPSFTMLEAIGPVLTGIHTNPSLDTSISGYLDEIQQVVSAAGETVTVVTDLVGDTNADFSVNGIELQIVANNFGSTGTYSEGDFNLDGVVNSLDLNILINNYGENLLTPPADFNNDNSVDHQDFIYIATHWGSSVQAGQSGDSTKDGFIDIQDVELFDDLWLTPESIIREVPVQITGDANFDGWVSLQDLNLLDDNFGATGVEPYTLGDVSGDGNVNSLDLNIIQNLINVNIPRSIVADVNYDGKVDVDDVLFITDPVRWGLPVPVGLEGRTAGDINQDNIVDNDDLALLATWWRIGYNADEIGQGIPSPEPATQVSLLLMMSIGVLYNGRRELQ